MSYTNTLQNHLLPFLELKMGATAIFQQDNAAIHTSYLTKMWLLLRGIRVLEWPACSPDLNPIENLWSHLARQVYRDARVYTSVAELKASLTQHWDSINSSTCESLVRSMPKRCIDVLKQNGQTISY